MPSDLLDPSLYPFALLSHYFCYFTSKLVTDHIDLGVGVSHVADNAAVLHAVEVLSHHHVLIAWMEGETQERDEGRTHKDVEKGPNIENLKSLSIFIKLFYYTAFNYFLYHHAEQLIKPEDVI